MRKWLVTAAAGIALTILAADLGAQTLHRSFEASVMGGIRRYDEDVVFLDSGWLVGGKLAWFPHANIGVEGTLSYSKASFIEFSDDDDLGDELDDIFSESDVDVKEFRIDAVYQMLFSADQMLVPYISAGVGQLVFDASQEDDASEAFDEPATSLNWGGGIKVFFTDRIALRLDARDNVALVERATDASSVIGDQKSFQANNPEFLAGLTIGFGGSDEGFGVRDSDFDGVPDKDDLCPNTPRGVIVDETGCPIESDGDGVPDGLDACPNTPQGAMVDERGCPLDSDRDGVYDGIDRCPNTPAGTQVDETGCPIPQPEAPAACLSNQDWYTGDATISADGRSWVKFGATRTIPMDQLTQIGEYRGVPIYARAGETRRREVYLPLCSPDNTYQPYRLESEVRGTTGYIRDAN